VLVKSLSVAIPFTLSMTRYKDILFLVYSNDAITFLNIYISPWHCYMTHGPRFLVCKCSLNIRPIIHVALTLLTYTYLQPCLFSWMSILSRLPWNPTRDVFVQGQMRVWLAIFDNSECADKHPWLQLIITGVQMEFENILNVREDRHSIEIMA